LFTNYYRFTLYDLLPLLDTGPPDFHPRNFFCSFSIHIANDSRLILYQNIYNDVMAGFEHFIFFTYCTILDQVVEQAGILDIPFFTAVAFI